MGQPQSRLTPVRKPQPGDHIYSIRAGGLYAHHGIYVGNDMVIHLQAPPKGSGSSSQCQKCGYKGDCPGGVVKTCLDSFLDGGSLEFYEYGVPVVYFNERPRGTCCVSHSKPGHEVVERATDLLERNGFGGYDLFANNCEDFAVYCKTGSAFSHQAWAPVQGTMKLATVASLCFIATGKPLPGGLLGIGSMALGAAYLIEKAITDAQRRR